MKFSIVIALCTVLLAEVASAWPVVLKGADFPALAGTPFNRLHALKFDPQQKTWTPIPIQPVQANAQGRRLSWNPEFTHPHRERYYKHQQKRDFLTDIDEVLLEDNTFTVCAEACSAPKSDSLKDICPGGHPSDGPIYKIVAPGQKTAFLTRCTQDVASMSCPFSVDLKERWIRTGHFEYRYTAGNHMLIEDLRVFNKQRESKTLLSQSRFDMYAVPRFWPFNLHFDSDDIISQLISISCGAVATIAEIEFELHVFLLRISLDLISQVLVFENGVHVPAIVTLPVSGESLRSGSGVFYGFRYPDGDFRRDVQTDIPFLTPIAETIPYSSKRTLLLQSEGRWVAADVSLPEYFRDMNFTPALATPPLLQARGFPESTSDFGIFYDVTQLRKGEHKMTAWFYAGADGEEESLSPHLAGKKPIIVRLQ